MIRRVPYTVNGKHRGCWYYIPDFLSDDIVVFLLHPKLRELHSPGLKGLWRFPKSLLREAREKRCDHMGVAVASSGKTIYWLTSLAKLERESVPTVKDGLAEIALDERKFEVRPSTTARAIERAMRLR